MALPIFQSSRPEFRQMQDRWASQLNPVLANPMTDASILKNITLQIGSNTINHLLARKLQGWSLVRQKAAASVYDNQDANQSPELTLILISDAIVSVDIAVF